MVLSLVFLEQADGLIILPALVYFLNLDEYKARGTTLATTLVATLITSIFYAKNNYFDLELSFKIVIGGIIGGYLGAKYTKKIPEKTLAIIFHIFLMYMSIKMIITG